MKEKEKIHHALESLDSDLALHIEDNIWWVQGRKSIIHNYLTKIISEPKSENLIIDIGCGSGGNLKTLGEFGTTIGVEPSPILAQRSRQRNVAKNIYEIPVEEIPESAEANVYTMFDVLEHIDQDLNFLIKLNKITLRGHTLLLSVPACPFLYGEHDRLLSHYRRYSKKALHERLTMAGYEVVSLDYQMFFAFPPACIARLLDKFKRYFGIVRKQINIGVVPAPINTILKYVLVLESKIFKYLKFPIGLWLFAVAKAK